MKIGFYLENRSLEHIDFQDPEKGNPGCGATEYLMVAVPYYLSKMHPERCTPVILANIVERLPEALDGVRVDDVYDAIRVANSIGCDFLVYRPRLNSEMDVLDLADAIEMPIIGWAQLSPRPNHLRKMARSKFFKALLCVEHEQYDLMQDSPAAKKMIIMPSPIDVGAYAAAEPASKEKGLVVYLGALVRQKGFHVLAKAWPRVLQRCPYAKLTVIGTGALYGESKNVGRWGVSDSAYEERFLLPTLSGADGDPHPSVHFAGRLGCEKNDLIRRAVVGVANPTGSTETFCVSAVEFQACEVAVVSGAYYALMDTVDHGNTGLLGRTEDDLVNNICTLLEDQPLAEKLGRNGLKFVRRKYNYELVTQSWINLLENLKFGEGFERVPFKRNILRHWKLLIAINRPLQSFFGRFMNWPTITEVKQALYPKIAKFVSK